MSEKSKKAPKGKMVEIDGIQYYLIKGKIYRYADLTLDKGFKIVLGRIGSEEVLMHLLNRMLGTRIKHLEYRNTEHPGMTEDERSSRFDVYCEDENGSCFQVEMQNWSQRYFHKRAVYYSSLILQDQAVKAQKEFRRKHGKKKRWNYDYQPLYVVSLLNYKNWTSENTLNRLSPYVSTYRYSEVETKDELGDGTNLVFIDLYSFKKSKEECKTLEDLWLYSIKNMFSLTDCPKEAIGTEVEELFIKAELAKMSIEQRIKYEEDIMTHDDILNSIDEQIEDAKKEAIAIGMAQGMEKGIAEGRREGRDEGRKEERFAIADRLISDGMTAEKVAEITGLSLEDVQKTIR